MSPYARQLADHGSLIASGPDDPFDKSWRSPRAIIETDLDGKIIVWGGRSREVFGWTSGQAGGTALLRLNIPDSEALHGEAILDILARGYDWSAKVLVQDAFSGTFVADMIAGPVLDASDQLTGFGFVFFRSRLSDRI